MNDALLPVFAGILVTAAISFGVWLTVSINKISASVLVWHARLARLEADVAQIKMFFVNSTALRGPKAGPGVSGGGAPDPSGALPDYFQ